MSSRLQILGWVSTIVVLTSLQCKTRQNRDYSRRNSNSFLVTSESGDTAAAPITTVHLILGEPDEFSDEEVAAIEAELSGTGGLNLAGSSNFRTAEERMAEAARKSDTVRGDAADLADGRRTPNSPGKETEQSPQESEAIKDPSPEGPDDGASASNETESNNRTPSPTPQPVRRSSNAAPRKKNAFSWGRYEIPIKDQTAASLDEPDNLNLVDEFWVRNPNLQQLVLHGSDSKLSRALESLQLEPPAGLTDQPNLSFTSEGQNGGLYMVRKSKARASITRQK